MFQARLCHRFYCGTLSVGTDVAVTLQHFPAQMPGNRKYCRIRSLGLGKVREEVMLEIMQVGLNTSSLLGRLPRGFRNPTYPRWG
jgi:hypothetical protein